MTTAANRIDDFGNFFNGFAKSLRVIRSSWILNECNLYCKIVKKLHSVRGLYDKNSALWYCFTSDVMYKKYKRLVYTSPDLLARFCKVHLSNAKKFGLVCFPRISFPGLIYCDQGQLWLCFFLGVHIRLSTRYKIKFTVSLDCLQISFL